MGNLFTIKLRMSQQIAHRHTDCHRYTANDVIEQNFATFSYKRALKSSCAFVSKISSAFGFSIHHTSKFGKSNTMQT